ncbi:MAG: hypothetical protein OEP45_12985 [Acidobacteriota bacterium]|nr:hypothetical protein [Acidobacteriota bacterium]
MDDAAGALEARSREARRARWAAPVLLAGALVAPGAAAAYETDQYLHRALPLADAVEPLNAEVNLALENIAARWRAGPDPRRFARAVYVELGGRHWVDRLERWAIRSPEIDKVEHYKRHSIYRGMSPFARRVGYLFGVGPTINVAGTRFGTDKLGHFISQGWKYHKRYLRNPTAEHAVRLGVRNEASIFGSPFTGSFSNADLVANYEGLRFYRSLFEDGIVGELPAIVEFTGAGARLRRPFDFRDHVNDYWDEALNPNRFDRLMSGPMLRRLATLCPEYEADPGLWVSSSDAELRERYSHLGMRDGRRYRLDQVCTARAPGSGGARANGRPGDRGGPGSEHPEERRNR